MIRRFNIENKMVNTFDGNTDEANKVCWIL